MITKISASLDRIILEIEVEWKGEGNTTGTTNGIAFNENITLDQLKTALKKMGNGYVILSKQDYTELVDAAGAEPEQEQPLHPKDL